ncbi:peptidase of plants and bacteria-domain-containing protein [Microdochium trichocladiopsis]|uniref:Peptidase of plants and bacteria-domain-containing protein n=1 Tax=Microdochium trichocladiopsis TaxID=1682393 RepID=A0A9P9BU52_9PEZI|nr:peptidase of plants and bacteria-domain-containing protein [Microdochium trichocladiopsis]KAH7031114.1 peptidase of plants and bacteria-domain-containing protein [Microdochium trichocladiopsis]
MSHPSSAPAPAPEATATPLPIRPNQPAGSREESSHEPVRGETPPAASSEPSSDGFKLPKLRLRIDDITHPGASIFLGNYNASGDFEHCVRSVIRQLYSDTDKSPSATTAHQLRHHPPPTRSVTLILRDMPGVAYTTGSDLDSDHKEIHFSLGYIQGINPPERRHAEIMGVVTHELVHCYQYNAHGTCPGGLIEGVADWVRLECQLAPPHWKRGDGTGDGDSNGGRWDAGYQKTAFFLEYLAGRFGADTVRRLNEKLRTTRRYEDKPFWTELVGRPVEQLWEEYKKHIKDKATEA